MTNEKMARVRKNTRMKEWREENKAHCKAVSKSYYESNKKERNEYSKKYYQKHKEKYKRLAKIYSIEYNLKSNYNLTLEQYDKMFEEQNGNCAICGLPQLMKRLAVDHDHETGEVRGLLCACCNMQLGILEDKEFCKKALGYLDGFSEITKTKKAL